MNREYVRIYPHSQASAQELEELDKWRASHKENIACREFIEKTIAESFDGMHLSADAAKQVIEEFGYKRTSFVLANSVQMKSTDGRFSRANKAWAENYSCYDDKRYRFNYAVDSHPAVLDGFINQYHRLYNSLGLIAEKQCLPETQHQNFEGKVVAVKPQYLSENHLDIKDQIWLCTGGFGCDTSGNAVYATCIADGEKARWERYQVLGVVDEQHLPDWAVERLEQMGYELSDTQEESDQAQGFSQMQTMQ